MKTKYYDLYNDPGHAWLKVPRKEVSRAMHLLTSCSYERGDYVYLEEDCDLITFINLKLNEGVEVLCREHISSKRSKIRRYDTLRARVSYQITRYTYVPSMVGDYWESTNDESSVTVQKSETWGHWHAYCLTLSDTHTNFIYQLDKCCEGQVVCTWYYINGMYKDTYDDALKLTVRGVKQ